jgi:hypothetical protein
VLRRVLVGGVACGRSGEARQRAVVPTLGVGVPSISFPVPALVGIIVSFQLLRDFFCRSVRVLIRCSSESNNRHRAMSLW